MNTPLGNSTPGPAPRPPWLYRAMGAVLGPVERWLNLDCRSFTRLASERLDRPLAFGERVRYRLHRLYCSLCRRHDNRIGRLRQLLRLAARPSSQREPPELPAESRERIRQRVTDELRKQ